MRAARVLMNLGRASALDAGRRRGADMEAWNRSRRTLLRARDAAERAGVPLGDEALGREAMMGARERSEREHGVPLTYEPGETAARDRPDSYFVGDPAARIAMEAKETAAGGYDPARQERANRAYRQQMETVSRGTEPQRGPAEISAGDVSEADLAAAYTGHVGPGGTVKPRWNPLTGRVGTPEAQQRTTDWTMENTRRMRMGLEPFESPELMLARRAQMTQQQTEAEAAAAEAEAVGAAAPQMAAAALAAEEAAARGAGAQATFLEGQSLPAQRMLELWQTPEGKQQVMAEWATASQQQKQAYAAQVLAEVGANLPPEIQQALAEAASGMRIEEYDGSWWQTGGVLGSVWDALAIIVRGRPTQRRAVPVAGTTPTAPTAPAGAVPAGATIPGNVDTATASVEELVAIRDAAEAELQRRQQMGAR